MPATPTEQALVIQAARAAWVAPVPMVLLNAVFVVLHVDPATVNPIRVGSMLLVVVGLVAAIFALTGIAKHGWRPILIPALVGLVLNGTILGLLAVAIVERLR